MGAGVALALGAWVGGAALLSGGPPPATAQEPAVKIGRTQHAEYFPAARANRPIFVLAIGSDARPGVCQPVERCLADSIHLIGINLRKRSASILGFPRDTYVEIPGHGDAKINESLFVGGPQTVVATVEALTGVPIDYYLLTSFNGLRRMVTRLGGIKVEIPYPMNDPASGAVFDQGPEVLDGKEALAFSRNRKDTPNGDFSRSENQGRLLLGALDQLQREFVDDPARLFTWMAIGLQYVQSDLSFQEVFDLMVTALSIRASRTTNCVMPGGLGFAGSASIVTVGSDAPEVFRDLGDDGLIGSC
jgi:polyisoprenyl-teichoic acid--peptidoglycan teichoic acid transferase